MATLRIIGGAWVYDYRLYGRRKRATLGREAGMTREAAEREVERLNGSLDGAIERQRRWQQAQSVFHQETPEDAGGLRVATYHCPSIARNAKKNAKRKGVRYTLTDADIRALIKESMGRCCISAIPFSDDDPVGHKRPFMPSLDRIECTDGYTYENCRLVCVVVNSAMNEWGLRILEQVAMGMASHVPPFRVLR